MLDFKVSTKTGEKTFHFPTEIKEIDSEFLFHAANAVMLAPNEALVALCHRAKLTEIVSSSKQKKNEIMTSIIPLFVKGDSVINDVDRISPATRIITAGSDLARGYHVNAPDNTLSIEKFTRLIADDNEVYKKAMSVLTPVYFVEFKIIPSIEIHGIYIERENNFKNKFTID